MVTTVDDIDAKLTEAASLARHPCTHTDALALCDEWLDLRNVAVLEAWWDLPCSVTADLGCGCPHVTLTLPVAIDDDGLMTLDQDHLNLACLAHHLGTHPDEP